MTTEERLKRELNLAWHDLRNARSEFSNHQYSYAAELNLENAERMYESIWKKIAALKPSNP